MIKKHPIATEWIAWLITRALLVYAISYNGMPSGDVRYYYRGITGVEDGALGEYPAVGVWPLWLIDKINFGGEDGYVITFIAICALVDAAFLALLQRYWRAATFWIAFGAAVAFILYLRIDIFQGVLVALAGWFLIKNPRFSATIIGIAAMMKLWPAILAAGLVDKYNKSATWIRIAFFVGTCAILGAIVIAYGGIERITSPLSYQQVRGLQIESLLATPFVLLAAYMPGKWSIDYAASRSFEIFGPGVWMTADIASQAMLVVFVFAFGWALWHFVMREWNARSTLAWMILIVLLLIASNKVFSPQYLLWVGPLVAVALVRDGKNRKVQWIAGLLVVMAVLSTIIFPLNYSSLTYYPISYVIAWVLAARNALLIVAIVIAARYVFDASGKNPPEADKAESTQTPEDPAQQPEPLGQPS